MRKKRATRLNAPTPRALPAVRPNAGIEAWYRRKLDDKIKEMQHSLVYWLTAEYRKAGFAEDAADGSGATKLLQASLRKQSHRWQWAFNRYADWLGKKLASRVLTNADASLASAVKAQGFAVNFTMTADMSNAYQAVIGENVGLIKSIASEHLTEVEGLVMRSVARGRDLGTLTKDLQARYGITRRRAALIARDQNNKATSVMTAARQKSLGITEGVWMHSHAGKVPRPEHVAADGKRFPIDKGIWMDSAGKYVMPGEEINCRCTWRPVIPGFEN